MLMPSDNATTKAARLRLRAFAVRDAGRLNALVQQPGVGEWFQIAQGGLPWAQCWQALMGRGIGARRFAVTVAGSDQLVGLVGLSRDGRLHYLIDPRHWGKGYATEAVGAALPLAFEQPSLACVEAEVFDANPASARVLRKLGFDVLRRTRPTRLGALQAEPAAVYGLSRANFEQRP